MEYVGGTLNITILAAFYTAVGALLSSLLFHMFDDCDTTWKSENLLYQLGDIFLELGLIGSVAFWVTYIIRDYAPIFPIHKTLDVLIDTYISSLFFAFAMFIFLDQLNEKIKYLYHTHVHKYFVRVIPENWSIMKVLFSSRKTNTKNDSAQTH